MGGEGGRRGWAERVGGAGGREAHLGDDDEERHVERDGHAHVLLRVGEVWGAGGVARRWPLRILPELRGSPNQWF